MDYAHMQRIMHAAGRKDIYEPVHHPVQHANARFFNVIYSLWDDYHWNDASIIKWARDAHRIGM